MEKIKKYNQKLLAILGTIAIIFGIIGLIRITSELIGNFQVRNFEKEKGILTDEKIQELQKEKKREQIISYHNPRLIDTLNQIYILPVSHKNLNKAESIPEGVLGVVRKSGNYDVERDSRYSRRYYGDFNNLIIYDKINETSEKLFKKRINFDKIRTEYFKDDIIVTFKASEKDTYKDGVINLMDKKDLYLYSIKEKRLIKIADEKLDVFSYIFANNNKDLFIRFGIDKNNDGKYSDINEPTIIKKFDYRKEKLTDIVNETMNIELQKTLEGS